MRATEWHFTNGEHYAYIMAHLVDGEAVAPVKIGISKHPLVRLKQVQAVMDGQIILVAKFCFWERDYAVRVERAFHKACRAHRLFGEWFDISPSDAVGLMAANLTGFVDEVLQPELTGDWYTAMSMIGVPGTNCDLEVEDFGHRQ